MAKIQFLGAAGGVTGSSYLITNTNINFLIDLGMFQGQDDTDNLNFAPLSFDVQSLQAVFVTHAHLDHCGRLPFLIKQGYSGKIYMTEATKEIVHLSLLDAANLSAEKSQTGPIYTPEEVEKVYAHTEIIEYDQPLTLGEMTVIFRNAGHILGSASIEVRLTDQTLVFSGDLGNTPEDLIEPTEDITKADVVVMESTYGDSSHADENASTVIQNEINAVEQNGGVLLIPAFSIERSQEIVNLIGELRTAQKIKDSTQIFLDSPMAIEVTEIFEQYPKLYNKELALETHPFDFPNLKFTRTGDESKAILAVKGPKVIIAGSGMMNGGRILHHLQNYVGLNSTRILIVGYQAEGTLGREILNGAKKIELYNKNYLVAATVTNMESLSSHADQPKLLNWLKKIQGVKKVFLTHGEDHQRQTLAQKIKSDLGIADVTLPTKDQSFETN